MTNNGHQRPKLLLIVPLHGVEQSVTNIIGGNKVTASELIHELSAQGFDLDTLDSSGSVTNLPPWKFQFIRLARFLRVVWGIARKVQRARLVFLVISPQSALIVASSLWVICKIARRPMALRLTGGDLNLVYDKYSVLARWIADRTWIRCARVYVETQQIYRAFEGRPNFRWLPNVRNIEAPVAVRRDKVNKIIFMARLEPDKGLVEVLEACRHLPEQCHLQVFGPGMSHTDFSLFENHPRATYGGVLDPAEVPRALSEHDLMVFPSYFTSEGYPGVIVEAFQCGLPVIATKWRSVPELVRHEENGLLVEPRSAVAVQVAIERLLDDPALYRRLCKGAKCQGEKFRSTHWSNHMASDIHSMVGR